MKDQGVSEDTMMGVNSSGGENHSGKEEDSLSSETEEVSLLPILSSSCCHLVYVYSLTVLLTNLVLLSPLS